MADADRFTVDSDELDSVIADVEKTESALQALTDDLEAQIKALQSVWEGLAADAQDAAQREWEQGMLAMRTALLELRQAARTAHGNYTGAADSNVSMWESLA